jgi:hypothetical protein
MAAVSGTKIVKNGLILNLDAANIKNTSLTSVEYLIVAGGGGGGGYVAGGGGGGGGVLSGTTNITNQSYTITVGGGGTAGPVNRSSNGGNGGNSSAFSLTAIGGGGGGRGWSLAAGNSGGSAGGTGGGDGVGGAAFLAGVAGTAGQGNAGGGGRMCSSNSGTGGGGGGAGFAGTTPECSPRTAGIGGQGISSLISGSLQWYAGGGGADSYNPSITEIGGLGGGGTSNGAGTLINGIANTGGGGGSAGNLNRDGGIGGSGIVIIRYPGPQRAIGGTVTRVGSDTVHTFTTVGNSTFTVLPAYVNGQSFTAVADLSNNGNIGIAQNGPTYSTDGGGSFVFDGVDDVIVSTDVPLRMPEPNFSLSIIFYWNNISQAVALASKRNGSPFNQYGFSIGLSYTGGSGKNLIFFARADNGGDIILNYSLPNLVGYFIATASVNQNSQNLYINGTLHSQTSDNLSGKIYNVPGRNFSVGAANNDTNTGHFNFFNGKIPQVQIYNRALTAQEIQENFEAMRGRYGL